MPDAPVRILNKASVVFHELIFNVKIHFKNLFWNEYHTLAMHYDLFSEIPYAKNGPGAFMILIIEQLHHIYSLA